LSRSQSKTHKITREYLSLSEIAIATYKLEKTIVEAIALTLCENLRQYPVNVTIKSQLQDNT